MAKNDSGKRVSYEQQQTMLLREILSELKILNQHLLSYPVEKQAEKEQSTEPEQVQQKGFFSRLFG